MRKKCSHAANGSKKVKRTNSCRVCALLHRNLQKQFSRWQCLVERSRCFGCQFVLVETVAQVRLRGQQARTQRFFVLSILKEPLPCTGWHSQAAPKRMLQLPWR